VAGVFDGISLTRPLWPHQVRALAALERDVARGDRATYLVVPPGGGKTLIGLEAARRLGRPTVVLCPNTAIQAQWMAQWQAAFGPDVIRATASRELPSPLTVLTYQALCTLGAPGDEEEAGGRLGPRTRLAGEEVLSLLHPNGRALIARLQAGGPWTLVLDECHHLLELWGRLLQAVIGELDKPRVVGLTATPPHLMTAEQAVLHRALFGRVDLEVSAPALVREGLLAPYQELAFLTRPTPAEADYIHGESLRFAELRAGLLDPGFASVPFLAWLQARVVERRGAGGTDGAEGAQVSWARFEKDEPALADARLVLETLLADPQAAALDPVLLTGRHVARGPECAERLLKWLGEAEPGLELAVAPWGALAEITGPPGWETRRYVPLLTRFHAEGGSRCLIGTRALLGEGWDAPAVNVVIDLTAATTPTSVVQARGRALRLDAGWPGKVADNWGVVCVTGDHPKGAADFDRFARKHDRYFALAQTGDIVSGVAHVDPRLSPYAPPPDEQCDALNATMLVRAGERDGARERWAIGTPFADEPVATVTVATRRPLGLPAKAAGSLTRWRRRGRTVAAVLAAAALAAILAAAAVAAAPAVVLVVALVLVVVVLAGLASVGRTASRLVAAPGSGSLDDLAAATADALHAAKLTSRGSDAVRGEAQADGGYRARLQEVPAAESALFAEALDEVLAPLSQPRYVIGRLILPPPSGPAAAAGLAVRRLVTGHVPATVVYHAVPTVLSGNKKLALAFERAWNTRVGPGSVVYAGSPEGTGILAAQRGDDPFALTTQIRTLWR
jgi:superfamily II DNA or RNA helicase